MKKSIVVFNLILCFSLIGCNVRNEDNPKMDESIMEADISGECVLPDDFFNNFADEASGFSNLCLSSFYDSPEDIDLEELFYNGFHLEVDDADRSFLETENAELDYDIVKLPASKMDEVMLRYLGISLSESNLNGIEKFYYNEENDCYYLLHTDFHDWRITIADQFTDKAGNINVIYSRNDDFSEKQCIAVLKKENDRYLFLSNQLKED